MGTVSVDDVIAFEAAAVVELLGPLLVEPGIRHKELLTVRMLKSLNWVTSKWIVVGI